VGHDVSIEDRLIAALRRIVGAIDLLSLHLAECFSVTGPQRVALQRLARPGPTALSVVARKIHLGLPTVTGTVNRLEQHGWSAGSGTRRTGAGPPSALSPRGAPCPP
jgi:hypothetical protein